MVLSAAFTPVTAITVVAVTTIATTTAAATTTATTAATTTTATSTTSTTAAAVASVGGVDAAVLDFLDLLVAVLLLALENQISVLPLGLLLQSEESLLLLLRLKLNKDAALEGLVVVSAAQADGVGGTVGGEKSLDIELCSGLFLTEAEALGVDGAGHGGIFEDLDGLGIVLVHGLGERDLALDGGVVVSQLDVLSGLESFNDRAERLEAAHALERVEELKGHGVVGAAANLGEQELVHGEVRIGEVEFDLWCER